MKVFLQIVGVDNVDSSPTIILNCDSQKYMFNCGESSVRLSLEYKLRYSKLSNIFATSTSWKSIGGLSGILLSLARAGNKQITIHGGKNLSFLIAAQRNFVFRMASLVTANELDDESSYYRDENIEVMHVLIKPQGHEQERLEKSQQVIHKMFSLGQNLTVPLSGADEKEYQRSLEKLRNNARRSFNELSLDPTTPSNTTIAYIIQGNKSKGKFNPVSAREAGALDSEFNHLHNGNALGLDNDKIIFPFDAMAPHTPGAIFIILECPTLAHMNSLIYNPAFDPLYFDECTGEQKVCVIVHITSQQVAKHSLYQNWKDRFGPDVKHVVFEKSCEIAFRKSAMNQSILNMLDSDIYPAPFYVNPAGSTSTDIVARMMTKIMIEPKVCVDLEECKDFFDRDSKSFKEFLEKNAEFIAECEAIKACLEPVNDSNVQIITLGTAAAIPSRFRNVSSTSINIKGCGNILLDAGEGTFAQLFRRFGDATNEYLANLKILFISHMHADHHIGAIRVLQQRKEMFDIKGQTLPPIWVIAPTQYFTWLQEFAQVEECGLESIVWIDSSLLQPDRDPPKSFEGQILAIPVQHCTNSFAIVINHKDAKIVFSGDCRPSLELIEHGKGADMLIHEATFVSPNEQIEAEKRRHSSVSEAIIVGKRMNASYTLLNHFSNRYMSIPKYQHGGVGVAFDLMSVTLGNVKRLDSYKTALQKLYNKDGDEEQMAGQKRKAID